MSKLAIFGGKKIRYKKFPAYNTIGKEEIELVNKVLKSGILSDFVAKYGEKFYGGKYVKELEELWCKKLNVKYAVSMNSATSCLIAAAGAIGLEPGDEVIISPWTMSATATSILVFNAIPVFADIQDDIFNLEPAEIEKKINERTKAIFVTHLLGHPAQITKIMELAKKYKLKVVEDTAQSPFAKCYGKFAGTFGDVGIFSLNFHKHIHTGEGGIAVTNDSQIYEKLLLIRNHGENAVTSRELSDITNILGFNFRMTEIQAAIGICQLKKFNFLQKQRIENIEYLNEKIKQLDGIIPAITYKNYTHSYYVHPFKYDEDKIGIHRDKFISAVRAELSPTEFREYQGPLLFTGYVRPLYNLKVYQQKLLYGSKGCPFTCKYSNKNIDYNKMKCEVAERLQNNEFFYHEIFKPPMTKRDLDDVAKAFYKVYDNISELKK